MLHQSGWKWIVAARTLRMERNDLLARLKRTQSKLNTAAIRAAEQLAGLRPGDVVTIHKSYFEIHKQNAQHEHTKGFKVLKVLLQNQEDITRRNPEIFVILDVGGKATYPIVSSLRDLPKYLTKVPKEK